ncbi:BAG family molecular chaperone regulator 1 [Syzygium oleosum]|uniref:BAG family molecular chaperone regulator 1 n=1 Tax=Syzygium oleosum TaxID=219896 RepID=UPI0011D1BDD5|nr:BAG family molecular chaperone regulator 1 [Syzygium oleosum]XP_056160218.1 BAG family molecular chaperone regulator 1 [Syzygium oleosum]XP_056160219.1 BAG family molecular chaperone regulator 1 [Syzygium oleosum]
MMRGQAKTIGLSTMNGSSAGGNASRVGESGEEWEVRPGGMLVQKRDAGSDRSSAPPPPTIRVRVKHGSTYHEISINSQATFGELKKMLTGPTGLHHQDQKLLFKDKERDSNAFLDIVGVKDRSKMVLIEDPISQEKRLLEMRRNAKMEKASKSISEISLQVDRFAGRVSAMESVISRGGKIPETEVLTLIELLMNQLLKLDSIIADGDVKLQRKMQVRRVQKYVETLDLLKIKNSMQTGNGGQAPAQEEDKHHAHTNGVKMAAFQHQQQKQHPNGHPQPHSQPQGNRHYHPSNHHQNRNKKQGEEEDPRRSSSGTVVTTKWETFDAVPPLVPALASSTSTTSPVAINNNPVQPRFNWELFE